ncbi:hypothetical protein CGRA01v4_12910 [Colletotrichum graminicola]|nr:hypothetical protein CGRA01v4_12910 [Colletotrichum graminicola]
MILRQQVGSPIVLAKSKCPLTWLHVNVLLNYLTTYRPNGLIGFHETNHTQAGFLQTALSPKKKHPSSGRMMTSQRVLRAGAGVPQAVVPTPNPLCVGAIDPTKRQHLAVKFEDG